MPITLTSYHDFNPDGIVFSEPHTIYPQNSSQSEYHKIYLQYYEGDERRDLVMNSPAHLMSFGIQEKRNRETDEIIGYHIPVVVWNRKGATDEEKEFTETLNTIVRKCQTHIQENYDVDHEKLSLLTWRTQNDEQYPVLYLKLITNRKTNRIMTLFINEDTNEELDPSELMNKKCLVTLAIKFENLYVGNNVSLQVKLFEVLVKFLEKKKKNFYRPQSLLRPSTAIKHRKFIDTLKENDSGFAKNPYSVLDDDKDIEEEKEEEVAVAI